MSLRSLKRLKVNSDYSRKNGAIAIKDDQVVECNAEKNLKIVDLTGAGDLFAAGFLHGYINKLSLKDSLEKG